MCAYNVRVSCCEYRLAGQLCSCYAHHRRGEHSSTQHVHDLIPVRESVDESLILACS